MKYYLPLLILISAIASNIAHAVTLEEKLITLNSEWNIGTTQSQVARLDQALIRSESVCDSNKEALAEVAWKATKTIRNEGHFADLVDIVEGVNASLYGANTKQDCSELLDAYTANRIQGRTHSDVVTGLRGLYKAIGAF